MASASIPIDVPILRTGKRAVPIAATDGELLMRFVRHRDQHAFAQIVERHGGLVWMICRQVLRHHQDVEDAFQATFLILAQRAGTIRATDSAAAWLYKVAQRTALAARRKRSRRREEELVAEPPVGEEALPMIHDREMLYVLMDELRTLPERYQTPLVLRYFENQSRRAIAEQTDSTLAQIQGRLARGRRMLRSRVVRRGVSLSLAAGAVMSAGPTANAAVTPTLVADTAQSCLEFNTSGAASGTSPAALGLAKEGIKAMWYASIIKPAAITATLLLTAGIVWAAQQGGGTALTIGNSTPEHVTLQTAATETDEAQQPAPATIAATDGDEPAAVYNVITIPTQQLELERDAWRLKAEAFQLKAQTKKTAITRLVGTKAMSESEASEVRADALLLEAESKLAEAKALGIEQQLTRIQQHGQPPTAATPPPPYAAPLREPAKTDMQNATGESIISVGDLIQIDMQTSEGVSSTPFVIEPMGTVALGPRSGRVKIAGMTVTGAEDAIKKQLEKTLKDVSVQITLAERLHMEPSHSFAPQAPSEAGRVTGEVRPGRLTLEQFQQAVASQFDALQRELNAVKSENAELKKQLEERTRPTERPQTPGSQIPPR